MKKTKSAGKRSWLPWIVAILTLCAICFLAESCSSYNPSLYPSYDCLNPGPEVRLNPLAFTPDGNLVVNQAFILWVDELKQEIKRLREELKRKGSE